VSLEYDSEYANLIVNHKLSYETINLKQEKGVVVTQQSNDIKKGLLPTAVEKFLKRRLYFETLKRAFKSKRAWNLSGASSELIH